jgi:hypothetical protein
MDEEGPEDSTQQATKSVILFAQSLSTSHNLTLPNGRYSMSSHPNSKRISSL